MTDHKTHAEAVCEALRKKLESLRKEYDELGEEFDNEKQGSKEQSEIMLQSCDVMEKIQLLEEILSLQP